MSAAALSARIVTRIGEADFDVGVELAALGPAGAVASFVGHVRADVKDLGPAVASLRLDHHPVMAHAALDALAQAAAARWPLSAVTIIHRVGNLAAGARIVLVATASEHRAAALDACAYCIDRLKTDVPLWKCETLADGAQRWVEARAGDDDRAAGWG